MELVAFISHTFSETVLNHYNTIKNSLLDNQQLVFISTTKELDKELDKHNIEYASIPLNANELRYNCIQIDADQRHPSAGIIFMHIYEKFPEFDRYWFIEYDVIVYNSKENNSFRPLFEYFKNKDYDVLCDHLTHLMSNDVCKRRYKYFIKVALQGNNIDANIIWKAFFPICRFSKAYLKKFHKHYIDCDVITRLYVEMSHPTFAKLHNFSIFSFDTDNLFSIPENIHPFVGFNKPMDIMTNIGSNGWDNKPYNPTNDYLLYHDNTIIHAIKDEDEKNMVINHYEKYNDDSDSLKIWICGNHFGILTAFDHNIYRAFDLSLPYCRYNINEYNRIFSEFVMMHYVYANNIYSKYIGTGHYRRYPIDYYIDYERIDNGEIQYFYFVDYHKYLDIDHYINPDFAFIERIVDDFGGPDMLKTDMIEYLQSNTVINVNDIIKYTKYTEDIHYFYTREIFVAKWEVFCDMMKFVENYIRFISNKYNIYSLYDWIEHVKDNIIEEYRKPKERTYTEKAYQEIEFESIYNPVTYGFYTSNCWRAYSYMIECLISIYIGTHKHFIYANSAYTLQ